MAARNAVTSSRAFRTSLAGIRQQSPALRSPCTISSAARSAPLGALRVQQQRSFSLHSASSVAQETSKIPSDVSEAVLADTFFTPLSDALLSLSSHYVALIPLYTIAFRLFTTLPVTLWQRRRTRRFADDIVPIIRLQQGTTERKVREECRARGASYEEYQKEFKKRAAADASRISKAHGVHPTLTMLLPPIVHIPLFIGTTMVLRDLCERSLAALSLNASQYASLQEFASTPFLWCPSLSLSDPSLILPLMVGLATISNVEVSSVNRRRLSKMLEGPALVSSPNSNPDRPTSSPSSAVNRASMSQRLRRRFSSSIRTKVPPTRQAIQREAIERAEKAKYMSDMRERLVSNILRISGVLFVPVAMFAPAAVCSYWITSNVFTLVQNLVFARIDEKRAAKKQVMDPTKRKSST